MLAITRAVSRSLPRCELTHLARAPIDLERARAQHRAYEQALSSLGVQVTSLPEEADLPDAVFVEDTAIVVDELAVITRPGAESRRPELDSIARALSAHRAIERLGAPATLDGGDVLRAGKTVYVGLSTRTNEEGITQLRRSLSPFGYTVRGVEVRGCLHLKSAVTEVADHLLLLNPAFVSPSDFDEEYIEVDPSEPSAANALRIGDTLIYPASHPKTRERLSRRGLGVVSVEMSELEKAEGAVTCCSLILG